MNCNDSEVVATNEIFGDSVEREIKNAKKALKDFTSYSCHGDKLYKEYAVMLDNVNKPGQAAQIMTNFRKACLN